MVLLQILLCILITNFISGVGHWWQDAYSNPKWPVVGQIVAQANLDHHASPRKFLKNSWLLRNSTPLVLAALIGLLFWVLGGLTWQVALVLLLLSLINEFHAFSHRTYKESGRLVVALQRIGLLQSRKHHGWHHRAPYDCHYCILTNWLNPLLDRLNIWYYLELVVAFLFGIRPIRNTSARNNL